MIGKCLAILSMILGMTSFASDELQQMLDSGQSIKTARLYLEKCEREQITVSLGNFGWNEVRQYWKKVPELNALRDEFETADEALRDVLQLDGEYAEFMNNRTGKPVAAYNKMKASVFRRLQKTSPEYRKARKTRNKALYTSNIESLRYIINDYEKQKWVIPTDWMNKGCRHNH